MLDYGLAWEENKRQSTSKSGPSDTVHSDNDAVGESDIVIAKVQNKNLLKEIWKFAREIKLTYSTIMGLVSISVFKEF